MINYGPPPVNDELEITLFGPGYGEAIAVHIGDGAWLLVDSCLNPETKIPASGEYLDSLGVGTNQVQSIVASHWHDDHVRGISSLAAKYAGADLVISAVFNSSEAATFLSAYSDEILPGLTGGAKELFAAVNNRDKVFFTFHKNIIIQTPTVTVTALSPMHGAFAQSIAHFAQYLPKKRDSVNHAPALAPNLESIVLHVDFGNDAILLGSDLEEHANYGWSAVIGDKWSGKRRPATAYKVAHHGSKSGDCQQIWTTLLQPTPVACMTPWTLMGKRLPTNDDKQRVRGRTSHAYISSGASSSPKMDGHQLKRLRDMAANVKLFNSSFGVVRLRKQAGETVWNTELFGAAQRL